MKRKTKNKIRNIAMVLLNIFIIVSLVLVLVMKNNYGYTLYWIIVPFLLVVILSTIQKWSVRGLNADTDESKVILMTPQGVTYNQKMAYDLSKEKHLIIICGHYEGFDERIRGLVDMEVSIGDYVLTGGEIPSMIITDSVTRLIDNVIREDSHIFDSFKDNLLDFPVYTKPVDFMGMKVPEVLLSGHHENINKWKQAEALKRTKIRRPDLLERVDKDV